MEIYSVCHKIHPYKVYNLVVLSIFTKLYNHHHYRITEHFHHPKKDPYIHEQSFFPPWQPLIYFRSVDLPIRTLHLNGFLEQVAFLKIFIPGFFHPV